MSEHYRHLKARDLGRLFKCDADMFMCSPHGEEWTFSFKGRRRKDKDLLIMYSCPVLINRKKRIRKLSGLKTRK